MRYLIKREVAESLLRCGYRWQQSVKANTGHLCQKTEGKIYNEANWTGSDELLNSKSKLCPHKEDTEEDTERIINFDRLQIVRETPCKKLLRLIKTTEK